MNILSNRKLIRCGIVDEFAALMIEKDHPKGPRSVDLTIRGILSFTTRYGTPAVLFVCENEAGEIIHLRMYSPHYTRTESVSELIGQKIVRIHSLCRINSSGRPVTVVFEMLVHASPTQKRSITTDSRTGNILTGHVIPNGENFCMPIIFDV